MSLSTMFIFFACTFSIASSRNVHQKDTTVSLRSSLRLPQKLQKGDLKSTLAVVLGGVAGIHEGHLENINKQILSMWQSLPTNEFGRVDRKLLQYAVHRYFMQTYSLSIVGLEPSQASGQEAVLLSQVVPSYVRSELEGKGAKIGFSIDDAVVMIATLERLVADTSHELLEKSYEAVRLTTTDLVGRASAKRLLEAYLLRWMLGDDGAGIEELEANQTLLGESLEDWQGIAEFAHGQLQALEYARQVPVNSVSTTSWNEFRPRFSFTDVESVVGSITMSFGNYWTTECQRVKRLLVDMDYTGTGRVKLSDFYGAAMNGEWRFSESKEYLKQLGALEESSSWQGPRVIITNYIQAASNCIVSAPHYRVCCSNECEDILGEVEAVVNAPLGTPDAILSALSAHASPLDDSVVKLSSSMRAQLQEIAKASPGGMVPIHGRLFAQWLHYAFPRECPFPHKSGETVSLSPLEFGDSYAASDADMRVVTESKSAPASDVVEDDWMSQWSHEEELLSESTHLHAPWEPKISGSMVCILLVLMGATVATAATSRRGDLLPISVEKTHCF